MSTPYKVIDWERNMFEGQPHYVIPPATSPEEIDRRRQEPGTTGPRAEHIGLQRTAQTLKAVPASDLLAYRYLSTAISYAAIGSTIYNVYPEAELGLTLSSRTATQRKKGELPNLNSRNPFDIEQRPTGLDMIDGAIERLEAAAEIAGRLINIQGRDLDVVRKQKIEMGKFIGAAAMHLACWKLADDISYGAIRADDFTVMHLGRETGIQQKAKAVESVKTFRVIPSIRQFAVEYSNMLVDAYTAGIPGVTQVLQKTSSLTLPS